MRKIIILIISMSLSTFLNNLKAQDKKFTGKVNYNCSIDIGLGASHFNAQLFFNVDSNYFQTISQNQERDTLKFLQKDQVLEAEYDINIFDTVGFKIITDKRSNTIFSREILLNKLVAVYEKIPNFNWTISEERKKIGEFDVQKATCEFRGRSYIAWFAAGISSNAGPYKFQGLPGLILEITDDKNQIRFIAYNITYPYKKIIPISPNYSPKPIPRETYLETLKKTTDRLSKYLQSTSSTDAIKSKITVKTTNIGIESVNEPF